MLNAFLPSTQIESYALIKENLTSHVFRCERINSESEMLKPLSMECERLEFLKKYWIAKWKSKSQSNLTKS